MWKCLKCARTIEDNFNLCWFCGTSRDGIEDPDFRPEERVVGLCDMTDEQKPTEPTPATPPPPGPSTARWSEEGMAALLLRLLGVYFTAWALISAADKIVLLLLALNKHDLDYAVSKYWSYFAYPAAELIVGLYFLIGGQWVYEKLLVPIHRSSRDDDSQASEEDGAEGLAAMAPSQPANTGQPQSPPSADQPAADGSADPLAARANSSNSKGKP